MNPLSKVILAGRNAKRVITSPLTKLTEEADLLESREKEFIDEIQARVEPDVKKQVQDTCTAFGIDTEAEEYEDAIEALRDAYTDALTTKYVAQYRADIAKDEAEKKAKKEVKAITSSFTSANKEDIHEKILLKLYEKVENLNNNNNNNNTNS